jgi:hypothetical protein
MISWAWLLATWACLVFIYKMGKGSLFQKLLKQQGKENQQLENHINEPFYSIRLNSKHLRNSETWDVKYLGCIQNISDWQKASNRTEFMRTIDQAQVNGQIMWSSSINRKLHISNKWLVVTDKNKTVAYFEVAMPNVGSLSCAEDEDRHFLGIKAAIVAKDGKSQYVCYILECHNEAVVRSICRSVVEIFQLMLAKEKAMEDSRDPGMRQVMMRRLSTSPSKTINLPQDYNRTDEWCEDVIQRHNSSGFEEAYSECNTEGDSMVSPLQTENVPAARHDGNVQQIQLENTEGMAVPNVMSKLLIPKGKQRTSLNSMTSSLMSQSPSLQMMTPGGIPQSQSLDVIPMSSIKKTPQSPAFESTPQSRILNISPVKVIPQSLSLDALSTSPYKLPMSPRELLSFRVS